MLGKCASGRKVSPLMAILLTALVIYSFLLFKRIRHQQQQTITLSRRKKDTSSDTLQDTFQAQDHPRPISIFSMFSANLQSADDDDEEGYLEDEIGLYIITPTYPRPEQLPELTRLSQTLMVKSAVFLYKGQAS